MKDFVTYEQAVKLKDLGFNWHNQYSQMYYATQNYCEGNNQVSFDTICPGNLISSPRMKEDEDYGWIEDEDYCVLAPTLAEAQRWLREVKEIDVIAIPTFGEYGKKKYRWQIIIYKEDFGNEDESTTIYTYEEALSIGINEALKIIENHEL